MGRQAHGLLRGGERDAVSLEEDAAGSHRSDESLRIALTLTHTGIERLLGERLDREDPDPYLAFTVKEPNAS